MNKVEIECRIKYHRQMAQEFHKRAQYFGEDSIDHKKYVRHTNKVVEYMRRLSDDKR